jgi:hypothetical protein
MEIKRIWKATEEPMSPEIQKTLRPLLNTDREYVSAFETGLTEAGRFASNPRLYTYYGAYIDDDPVGSLIVLSTGEVSYIMADNLTIYEKLLDVYMDKFDVTTLPPLRRNVSRIPRHAPPMHTLEPGQKEQPPFHGEGFFSPTGSVPREPLPPPQLDLNEPPKPRALEKVEPTPKGTPSAIFPGKTMGGTRRRRRRNLRKKNKKTRKWISSGTRKRD